MPVKAAFVGHESACAALRLLSAADQGFEKLARWPEAPRKLPAPEACVLGQRDFKAGPDAALLGLGLRSRPTDLLAPTQESRSRGKAVRLHVWSRSLPAGSMVVAAPGLVVSGPELAVIQLCSAQGKLDALLDAHVDAVRAELRVLTDLNLDEKPVVDHPLEWERIRRLVAAATVACEFSGTYRLACEGRPVAYEVRPLMSLASLARAIAEVGESQGTRRARRVCGLAFDRSASPMETSVALMLTLPVGFGGFGIERPQLNCSLDVSAHRGGVSDRDVVTPDLLWAEKGVALEYDSAEFHARRGGKRREADAVRANILAALGYRVLRATPEMVRTLPGLALLARQIARALGTELVAPTPVQDLRRRKLYMQLMPRSSRDA